MKVTDTQYGKSPQSRTRIALQNGDFDIETLVLTARAHCENCLEESFFPITSPRPNKLAEQCSPRDFALTADRGVDVRLPLAVLEQSMRECTADVKFTIPEHPRRPLSHENTSRCANQTLKFVSSLARKWY